MALYDSVKEQASFGYATPQSSGSAPDPYQPQPQKKGLFGGTGLRPVKQSKMMLKSDLNRLQTDPDSLGLSQSQQETMIGNATQAARTGAQAQTAQLSRDALAGQGFQAGAFQQAQQNIADTAQDAGVQAAAGVNQLHTALVQQEKSRIMGDLDAARERTRENTRFWMQFGVDGFSSMMSMLNSGSGGAEQVSGLMGGAPTGAAAPAGGGAMPAAGATGATGAGAAASGGAVSGAASAAPLLAMSARDLKRDIEYINAAEAERLYDEVVDMKLARWRYNPGLVDDQTRLGVIIDDAPDATMVSMDQRTIDLYTYASMMAAAVQHQARVIEDLRAALDELRDETLDAIVAMRND